MNDKLETGSRVHYYGVLGTIVDFQDWHREYAEVEWESGATETIPVWHLRAVTPDMEEILRA